MTRGQRSILVAIACVGALSACTAATPDGLTAINLRTGEIREFEEGEAIPAGWGLCSDEGCPEPDRCANLDEASCLSRSDCEALFAGSSDTDVSTYFSCVPVAEECEVEACGPPLGAPAFECEDGSLGGHTGRCLRTEDESCVWEIRDCPDPEPRECSLEECGPAPGAPNWECADGSIGGPYCGRNDEGDCGWLFNDCDIVEPPTCTIEQCGPAPGANPRCVDGTDAEAVCELVSGDTPSAETCGWQFLCNAVSTPVCGPYDCGPVPPVAPSIACASGTELTPECRGTSAGTCVYDFICLPVEDGETPDPSR